MSTFTNFSDSMALVFSSEASVRLDTMYWRILPVGDVVGLPEGVAFRYYIGSLGSNRWVDVKVGKHTDGATVPFPFNALIPVWGGYDQAIALHDHLCDSYVISELDEKTGNITEVKLSRKEIDSILDEALGVLGVTAWRHKLIMLGINLYRIVTNPKGPRENAVKLEYEQRYLKEYLDQGR